MASAVEAVRRVAEVKAPFVTRGDNSGTHQLEKKLWKATGMETAGQTWYQQTGQGMGATLVVASEKGGYTLSDRGTYLAQRANLDLNLLVEGDAQLFNVYHVIIVNPEKHSEVNVKGARAFAAFLTSSATQDVIRNFGRDKYGEPLFVPDAYVESTPGAGSAP